MSTLCPECEAEIAVTTALRGDVMTCPDCGVELEIISVTPFTVDRAPKEDEDWGE